VQSVARHVARACCLLLPGVCPYTLSEAEDVAEGVSLGRDWLFVKRSDTLHLPKQPRSHQTHSRRERAARCLLMQSPPGRDGNPARTTHATAGKRKHSMPPQVARSAHGGTDDDDDECSIVSPPTRKQCSSSLGSSSSGAADLPLGDDDDGSVVIVGVGREPITLPHARFDCFQHPLADDAQQHCSHCWCALCEVPVAQCNQWAEHCTTTAAAAATHRRSRRETAVQARLAAAPRPPPAASATSEVMQMNSDPRWGAMRFTTLSWLTNCGHDFEGVSATIAAVHDLEHAMASRVLSVLESLGDIVSIDGELYVRPGTELHLPPPQPPPQPPPPPQQRPLSRADIELLRRRARARPAGPPPHAPPAAPRLAPPPAPPPSAPPPPPAVRVAPPRPRPTPPPAPPRRARGGRGAAQHIQSREPQPEEEAGEEVD
jgi:hypothetical protein